MPMAPASLPRRRFLALFLALLCAYVFTPRHSLTLLQDWVTVRIPPLGSPPPDTAVQAFLLQTSPASTQPLLVTESNSHFHPLTRWWIDTIKRLRPPISDYAIVALDAAERDRLVALRQPVIYNKALNMNWNNTGFRSRGYNRIVRYKWQIVVDILRSGRPALLSDVDIYLRRNPLPYLEALPQCDMYFGTDLYELPVDTNTSTVRLYPPFPGDGFQNWVNTGFMLLRPRPAVIDLATRVLLRPMVGKDDQYIFNTYFDLLFWKHQATSRLGHDAKTCGRYGPVTFHFLRPDHFQNRRVHESYPAFKHFYAIHFNFLGSLDEKVEYMTRMGFMSAAHGGKVG